MWEALGEQGDVKNHHELSPGPHAQQGPLIPATLASSFWAWDPLCHPGATNQQIWGTGCVSVPQLLAPHSPPQRGCCSGQSRCLHPTLTSCHSRLLGT